MVHPYSCVWVFFVWSIKWVYFLAFIIFFCCQFSWCELCVVQFLFHFVYVCIISFVLLLFFFTCLCLTAKRHVVASREAIVKPSRMKNSIKNNIFSTAPVQEAVRLLWRSLPTFQTDKAICYLFELFSQSLVFRHIFFFKFYNKLI